MLNADFDYEAQILGCARGEQVALRRLYDQEAGQLLGVALRIVRRREVADEVLHDAFLSIWQKSATYSPALGSGRGWILTIVRNRALDVARQSGREISSSENTIEDIPSDGLGPLEALSRNRDVSALCRCLECMDEQKRACILLAYLDGYSHQQIADRLACPLGTVKTWTRRGLIGLKACLSQRPLVRLK
jgi:RNA polymerase sigma-70 factor (ECF subfamily)